MIFINIKCEIKRFLICKYRSDLFYINYLFGELELFFLMKKNKKK